MYEELFRFAIIRDPIVTQDLVFIELNTPVDLQRPSVSIRDILEEFDRYDLCIKSLSHFDNTLISKFDDFLKKLENIGSNSLKTVVKNFSNELNKPQKFDWKSFKENINNSLLCHKFLYKHDKQTVKELIKIYRLIYIKDDIEATDSQITKENLARYLKAPIVYTDKLEKEMKEPTQKEKEMANEGKKLKSEADRLINDLEEIANSYNDIKNNFDDTKPVNEIKKLLKNDTLKHINHVGIGEKFEVLTNLNGLFSEKINTFKMNATTFSMAYNKPNIMDFVNTIDNITKPEDFLEKKDVIIVPRYDFFGPIVTVLPSCNNEFKDKEITGSSITKFGTMMDLLIVKQKIKGYKAGEVAHIENVMASEKRERRHTRTHTTEDYYESESEVEEINEQDMQTTERMELSRESEKVINEETNAEAGLTITAKYGAVKMVASGSIDSSKSTDSASKSASKYAKEVVNKARKKVTEKIRKLQTRKIINQIEEMNLHSFDNTKDQAKHISGVYQFYDKVYQAKIYNYGKRDLYNILVPEPASMYLSAFPLVSENDIPMPKCPDDLILKKSVENITNSLNKLIEIYGVVPKLRPISEKHISWVSGDAQQGEGEGNVVGNHLSLRETIQIPDGYKVVRYTLKFSSHGDGEDYTPKFAIHIADRVLHFKEDTLEAQKYSNISVDGKKLEKVTEGVDFIGEIPVGISADDYSAIVVTVDFTCKLLDEYLNQWKRETYELFYNAYKEQKERYDTAMDEREFKYVTQQIEGRNPSINRKIELEELKRATIEIFLQNSPDWNLVTKSKKEETKNDCTGEVIEENNYCIELPKIDYKNRKRVEDVVFFIEQAFEWENMTYLFYPYFWGNKADWLDKIKQDITDYKFLQFIKAGSARVQIPVRSGFEKRVDYFMESGKMWEEKCQKNDNNNCDETIINHKMLTFSQEEALSLGKSDEVEYLDDEGNPIEWDVVVPTNLIKLRDDDKMPRWWDGNDWKYGSGNLE